MTLRTFKLSVITDQGVACFSRVIKFFDIFPTLSHMATAAFFALELLGLKEVNVIFFVTGKTGGS